MSRRPQKQSAFTPKRIRRSVKLDRVNPSDWLNYDMVYACEQCSFFNESETQCMMGFPHQPHLKNRQLKTFYTTSHMAFCRFLEID